MLEPTEPIDRDLYALASFEIPDVLINVFVKDAHYYAILSLLSLLAASMYGSK